MVEDEQGVPDAPARRPHEPLPAEGERCIQWSSYDRKSLYDAASGKYVAWDANGDGDGIIRKEEDKLVFAEMEGPGCIWRIWPAAPKEGHVRIYVDGASEPAVDLPFVGYFDRKNEPFTRSAIVHTVAMGWNNYTPIPFQKSCKLQVHALSGCMQGQSCAERANVLTAVEGVIVT